ncbi:M23 family metallopeptidase [Candidatus Bathyarchaeota archaeon]|nr:M23 family metallopeptidase [Candidatus Bathyarchaeota archaeon]
MKLSTVPRVIYKESDQLWPADKLLGAYDSESWAFYIVVRITEGVKPIRPLNVEIKLISKRNVVKTVSITGNYLKQLLIPEEKVDLLIWNRFVEPKKLNVDSLRYTLQAEDAETVQFDNTLEIPLSRYKQKVRLVFPLKGKCIVAVGHEYNEHHRWDRSQFSYDIFPLGSEGQLTRKDGSRNEQWWGYGTPVVAPSAGVVIYARDDIPENERPGVLPSENFYKSIADQPNATAGNHLVIDHGNDEHSLLAHLRHKSVAVRKGDHVTKGQQIGLVGNSGRSEAPHLHYALRNAPDFICDGLPSNFENLKLLGLEGRVSSPKRGLFLLAK